MSPRQATLLTVLVIVGTVAVGLPAVTAQETATETVATQNNSASGMGAQLTAFLQSNSAAANDTVGLGMWRSATTGPTEPNEPNWSSAEPAQHERRLERRRSARYARTAIRIGNLVSKPTWRSEAGSRQKSRACRPPSTTLTRPPNVRCERHRTGAPNQNASKLSGQQVASIARGIAGPPETAGPDDQGPPDVAGVNRSEQGPPDGVGTNQSEQGPPANTSERGANQSEQGPPADVPGQQRNVAQVPPDERVTIAVRNLGVHSGNGAEQ